MSRVDGSGKVPPRQGMQTPKVNEKKKDGASFDDFLEKTDEEAKETFGKRLTPSGPFGKTGIQSPGRGPLGASTGGERRESAGGGIGFDDTEAQTRAKDDELRREKTKETEPTGGPVRAEAGARTDGLQAAQKASDVQMSREMMQKLVESVRVGQNRAGSTEIQMDLKATVFEGMSLKVSKGPQGLVTVMTVDQISAKQAIEAQVSELVARLEAQGMDVAEVRVEVRDTPTSQGSGDRQGNPEDSESGGDPDSGSDSSRGVERGPGSQDRGSVRPASPDQDSESSTDYTL